VNDAELKTEVRNKPRDMGTWYKPPSDNYKSEGEIGISVIIWDPKGFIIACFMRKITTNKSHTVEDLAFAWVI